MQAAAALDPTNSLLRSYLGKAYYEGKRLEEPGEEYATGKALDPSDPTPWLYWALANQERNRVNDAVRDLETSQNLNDNRQLFRSRLLLEQEPKVEGAPARPRRAHRRHAGDGRRLRFRAHQVNRATQAKRQPGSAFKPIVYAAAPETLGYTPATILVDSPLSFPNPWDGSVWSSSFREIH